MAGTINLFLEQSHKHQTTNEKKLDFDNDSEMLSSPDSPTPQHNVTTHRDLSPPASQSRRPAGTAPSAYSLPGAVESASAAAAAGQSQSQQQQTREQQQQQPGASWMNPRAQEEYNRALEHVVDQDFNLSEWSFFFSFSLGGSDISGLTFGLVGCFGDLYDERELE